VADKSSIQCWNELNSFDNKDRERILTSHYSQGTPRGQKERERESSSVFCLVRFFFFGAKGTSGGGGGAAVAGQGQLGGRRMRGSGWPKPSMRAKLSTAPLAAATPPLRVADTQQSQFNGQLFPIESRIGEGKSFFPLSPVTV